MTEPTGTQTLVPAGAPLDKLTAAFEEDRLRQIQLALPDNVSSDKFLQVANRALIENPALMAADRASLFTAVSQCAASSLEPDGKQSALVIYKTKVKGTDGQPDTWIQKVQFMPMVGGFRKIAAEHGWSIEDEVVRANDEFEYEGGLVPRLVHRKPRPGVDRGALEGAYAVCRHRGHDPIVVVLDREDVMRLKGASKTSSYGPWKDWEPEMWRKSAARKAFKQLPLGEKETVRLRALLDELPVSDVAAMYGSEDRPALAAARDVPPTDLPPAGEAPQAAPQPDDSTGGGGSGEPQWPADDEPQALEPGDVVLPDGCGRWAGLTISAVAQQEPGREWLLKALAQLPVENEHRQAIASYMAAELPETWERYCGEAA